MKCLGATVTVVACACVGTPVAAADESIGFTSPSGNIGCVMDAWSVRCDVRDRAWAPPPRPADCPDYTDYGQGIVLRADDPAGAQFVCAGDTALNAGPVVDYGETQQVDSIRCQIWPDGVTCTDFMNGKGFWLSREGYRFL